MNKLLASLLVASFMPALALAEEAAPTAPATSPAASASKSVQVEKAAVGTAIENKELAGTETTFDSSVSQVYCWTKVMAESVPTSIHHVWYAGDQKEADVTLEVKYPSTRTWSSKKVWPGSWKVDVTSEAGEVLSSTEFTVQKSTP